METGVRLFYDRQHTYGISQRKHYSGGGHSRYERYQNADVYQYRQQSVKCSVKLSADLYGKTWCDWCGVGFGGILYGIRRIYVCRLSKKGKAVLGMEGFSCRQTDLKRMCRYRSAGVRDEYGVLHGICGVCRVSIRHGDNDLCGPFHSGHGGDDLLYPGIWPADGDIHPGGHFSRGEQQRKTGDSQQTEYCTDGGDDVSLRCAALFCVLSADVPVYTGGRSGGIGGGDASAGGVFRTVFRVDDRAGGNFLRHGAHPLRVSFGDREHVGHPDPVYLSLCDGLEA